MTVGIKSLLSLDSRRSRAIAAGVAVVGLLGLSMASSHRESSAQSLTSGAALANAGSIASPVAQAASTAPLAGKVSATPTTTPAPATTAAPPKVCGGDQHASFGCPVYVDDFNGTSLNGGPQGWTVYDYPDANFPRVAQNLHVANGEAQLVGTYDQNTGTILGAGMNSHISEKYGRWEVRVKVDQGKGFSAASLLWPTSEKWPTDGEVDLFEIPRSNRADVYQVIHNGVRDNTGENKFGLDATQWHTYAVEWTPTKLTYYVDGKQTWTVTKSALVPSTGNLDLTLQMDPGTAKECGKWFECPNSTTPASTVMHVDYAKIWAYNG